MDIRSHSRVVQPLGADVSRLAVKLVGVTLSASRRVEARLDRSLDDALRVRVARFNRNARVANSSISRHVLGHLMVTTLRREAAWDDALRMLVVKDAQRS